MIYKHKKAQANRLSFSLCHIISLKLPLVKSNLVSAEDKINIMLPGDSFAQLAVNGAVILSGAELDRSYSGGILIVQPDFYNTLAHYARGK